MGKTFCRCPLCGSKRLKPLRLSEFYCPRCREKFSIKSLPLDICYHCGKGIVDTPDAVLMGNGKFKHSKCRRGKTVFTLLKGEV